jgi:hypothetical protein
VTNYRHRESTISFMRIRAEKSEHLRAADGASEA